MSGGFTKAAVITGAASGIGRALAIAWARRGWKIGIVDIDMDEAANTLEMVRQAGGTGEVFRCNVRDPGEVQAAADYFFDTWGTVGLLVNNAGVFTGGYVGDIRIEDWERVIETNLWGVIYGCHAFIPGMKEQGGGHIVNIASCAGVVSMSQMGPYNITKAGVISLSETLRTELAPSGIDVTVACPMFLNTNLLDDMSYTEDWEREAMRLACGSARVTAEDIARRIVRAVEKNRLYVFPQVSAKLFWWIKRVSPPAFYGLFAAFNRMGLLKPIFMKISRIGWV